MYEPPDLCRQQMFRCGGLAADFGGALDYATVPDFRRGLTVDQATAEVALIRVSNGFASAGRATEQTLSQGRSLPWP
jgi:hypothetical protein